MPVACLVLALIGLALGASNRKDGKLASFALGIGVIFVYYVLLWTSRAPARSAGGFTPELGALDAESRARRCRALACCSGGPARRTSRFASASRVLAPRRDGARSQPMAPRSRARQPAAWSSCIRVPHLDWPRPSLLDLYVSRQYLRVFLLGIWRAARHLLHLDVHRSGRQAVPRRRRPPAMLLRYFYFATPQFVYYIIPMAALVATLVTIGLMTKNSELDRHARVRHQPVPLGAAAAVLRPGCSAARCSACRSSVLAELEPRGGPAQRIIRGLPPQTFGASTGGGSSAATATSTTTTSSIRKRIEFSQLSTVPSNERDAGSWTQLTYAERRRARAARRRGRRAGPDVDGATRDGRASSHREADARAARNGRSSTTPFAERAISLEPPAYFKTDEPDAEPMTYGELKRYIGAAPGQRLPRRAVHGAAAAEGRVSLRHRSS